jgi:hypothetical protein
MELYAVHGKQVLGFMMFPIYYEMSESVSGWNRNRKNKIEAYQCVETNKMVSRASSVQAVYIFMRFK